MVCAARLNAQRVNSNPVAVKKRSDFLREYGKLEATKLLRREITTALHKDKDLSNRMKAGLQKGNTPEMWAARSEKMKSKYADEQWNSSRIAKSLLTRKLNARKKGPEINGVRLTTAEWASVFGVTSTTFRKWVSKGSLESVLGAKSAREMKEIMETVYKLAVPVLVSDGRGKSWGEAG